MSNVINAFQCDMENLEIIPNYHQIQFSKGKGIDPQPLAISSPTPLTIVIEWLDNGAGTIAETDYMVALFAEDNDLNVGTLFFKQQAFVQIYHMNLHYYLATKTKNYMYGWHL